MHNKLRRDIVAFVTRDRATPTSVTAEDLLTRALNALGGPVGDNRPPQTTAASMESVSVPDATGYSTTVITRVEPDYSNEPDYNN